MNDLLDKALDFIVETQIDNEYICEQNDEWCETHCIDHLRKECVVHYLETIYEKGGA